MDKVTIDEVGIEVNPLEVHDVRRPVSRALGTEHFAMNYFELAPGDSFSGGANHDWEELESMVYCDDCGEEQGHATALTREGRFEFTCTECGTETTL